MELFILIFLFLVIFNVVNSNYFCRIILVFVLKCVKINFQLVCLNFFLFVFKRIFLIQYFSNNRQYIFGLGYVIIDFDLQYIVQIIIWSKIIQKRKKKLQFRKGQNLNILGCFFIIIFLCFYNVYRVKYRYSYSCISCRF